MGRSIFGWDLPPGCTMADIERNAGGGDLPPCCDDCNIDPCDDPEECERYKSALKANEEFNKLEAEQMEKDLRKIMKYCDICGDDKVTETTHLSLYVNGSEGIEVCLRCRGILTDLVRGIQSIKNSVIIRTLKGGLTSEDNPS